VTLADVAGWTIRLCRPLFHMSCVT